MRTAALIVAIVFFSTDAFAQRKVYGTVTDGRREPLAGAAVIVNGYPSAGAVTDAEGHYELLLPGSGRQEITVSFIGFSDSTVSVDGGGDTDFFSPQDAS